jgi:sugar phosphate isomerase/epimerase
MGAMPRRLDSLAVVSAALSPDPRAAAVAARQAGFGGLQFDAFSPTLNLPELSGTGRREFLHVLSSQNCRLAGLRVDLGAKGLGPGSDVDRALSQLQRVMEAAVGLAAPLVCCELGPLPEPPPLENPRPTVTPELAGLILLPSFAPPAPQQPAAAPDPFDSVFAATVDGALAELGARADRMGVTLAIRSDLASVAALNRALLAARCPWFGVDLDPVAILRDAWHIDEIFSRLGPLIRHVRGRDAVRGADRRTKPATIGRGDTQWDQLLSNLDAAGYHGWITIDPMEIDGRPAAAVSGRKYLEMHFVE